MLGVLILLGSLWLVSKPSVAELGIAFAEPAKAGQSLTVTWFGVTTLLIDDGVTQILIDGYFSRPSLLDIALERAIEPDQAAIEGMLQMILRLCGRCAGNREKIGTLTVRVSTKAFRNVRFG